jgi:hypothetical protein
MGSPGPQMTSCVIYGVEINLDVMFARSVAAISERHVGQIYTEKYILNVTHAWRHPTAIHRHRERASHWRTRPNGPSRSHRCPWRGFRYH